jgi:hypothetical protein
VTKAGLFVVASAVALAPAFAQTWSTGYFNTNSGYVSQGSSLDGQATNAPASEQWKTIDPYNPSTDRGSTSLVAYINNYTPGLSTGGNNSVYFGGYNADGAPPILPGITNPFLYRSFSNPNVGGAIATIDFAFIGPSTNLSPLYTNKDSFSFNLGTLSGTGSLAKFTLNPFGGTTPGSFSLDWIQNGTNVVADGSTFKSFEMQYNAIYRLVASLSATEVDLDIQGLSPQAGPGVGITNYLVTTNVNVISNGVISDGFTEADFESFGLEWNLRSGDTNAPGANYLIMTTASVVPEPSTFLMVSLGGLLLGAALWRRREHK